MPSPGDLPYPGIKLESPVLQADSLPAELPGKPNASICRLTVFLFAPIVQRNSLNIELTQGNSVSGSQEIPLPILHPAALVGPGSAFCHRG